MSKKVSYINLLKESITEVADVEKSVDVKGPMLDPILGYDGGGELPTHKDAASVLERYYFNEDSDKGVSVEEAGDPINNVIDDVPEKTDAGVSKTKKELIKALTTESDDEDEEDDKDEDMSEITRFFAEQEDEIEDEEEEGAPAAMKESDDEDDEDEESGEVSELETVESSVINKLIGEMEEEEKDEDEEVSESDKGVGGEEPAGLGDKDKVIPDRKDATNESNLGPIKTPNEGEEKPEDIEEAFQIFKEEIESDDEDLDPNKITV